MSAQQVSLLCIDMVSSVIATLSSHIGHQPAGRCDWQQTATTLVFLARRQYYSGLRGGSLSVSPVTIHLCRPAMGSHLVPQLPGLSMLGSTGQDRGMSGCVYPRVPCGCPRGAVDYIYTYVCYF